MKTKLRTTGLSLKRFVSIAREFNYVVYILPYTGCLTGWDSSFKSPFGRQIISKKHYSYKSLKRAFESC